VNGILKIKDLLKQTYERMWAIDFGLHSAAIAFYAIFSTAPLIIILLWIAGLILGQQVGEAEFQSILQNIVGPDLTVVISHMVSTGALKETGIWSSLLAAVTLLFGATTLLTQLKSSLNSIWEVGETQFNAVTHFLWDRLISVFFIMVLSLIFLAGLLSESILFGLEHVLISFIGQETIYLVQVGSSLANILLAFIFFTVMFKTLPDIRVRWRDVAVGALVTTLLVLIGKSLVDWYLGTSALQPMFKVAGSFVIFLLWIYYNVQVVLIGAIFTHVYTSRYGGGVRPYWNDEK